MLEQDLGSSYDILTTISREEVMTRIGRGIQNGERWDKVKLNDGLIGYVFQSYIKEYKEEVEEPPKEEYYVNFDTTLRIEEDTISNLNYEDLSVESIKGLIDTNLNIEIYNNKQKLLDNTENIGTGSKLVLKDTEGIIKYEYVFILYGDVNGDGTIDSLDSLVIQKHLLEIKLITDKYLLKSANIQKTGEEPTSLDIFKIQKHILEIKFIEQ